MKSHYLWPVLNLFDRVYHHSKKNTYIATRKHKLYKKWILRSLLIFLTVVIVKCTVLPKGAKKIDYPAYEGASITYLLVDGLEKRTFEKLMHQGRLPHMRSAIEKGLYVPYGIGSFPSMTGYAFYPFLTGADANDSGVIGLRWYDRSKDEGAFRNYVGRTNVHMNRDLQPDVQSVFEMFSDYYTCSVNSYMTRGVKDEVKTGWAMTTAKYGAAPVLRFFSAIPILGPKYFYSHYTHENLVTRTAIKQLSHNPPVQWITFAGPDAYAHVHGMDTEYEEIIEHIDAKIGEIMSYAQDLNQNRYFAIITDHGLENVHRNEGIVDDLNLDTGVELKRGKSTHLLSDKLNDSDGDEHGYFVINGNLSAMIYLNKVESASAKEILYTDELRNYNPGSFEQAVDMIDYLINQDAISMLIYRDDSSAIIVTTDEGSARIETEGDRYRYIDYDFDVFGFRQMGTEWDSSQYYSKDEWLTMTYDSPFPDAVFRCSALLSNPRCGDIVLLSAPGYDFGEDYEIIVDNYKGGHGGLRASMLAVPYILAGPGIKADTIPYARSEDLGYTILKLLDLESSGLTKGNDLLNAVSDPL